MFDGQTAIVTGGTRGIGRAVCEALLLQGAKVVAVYGGNDEKAAAFKKDNEEHGTQLETVRLNVADFSAVESFYNDFSDKNEKLDILVNVAGIRRDAIVGLMSEEEWKTVIDVNLSGTFHMCKMAVRLMSRKRYGRIINITSPIGTHGFAGQANYAASKAGQIGFTRSLAKEVASRKITANCVSPGFIDTDFIGDLPDEQKKAYCDMVPLKRFGVPEEVAYAVVFLAGSGASYITGATLDVTGGF